MALRETPLAAWHRANGAKMAEFAGWDMPIQYPTGILAEHLHTREKAGLFDICHMGEFFLGGEGATEALSRALTVNTATLKPGRCRYGFLLNEQGGIKDDLIVYRLAEERYMIVVNAGCRASDFAALQERLGPHLSFTDRSDEIAKIDLQGPESVAVLEAVHPGPWRRLPYFGFVEAEFEGEKLLVSRTGYTGELGFELYLPAHKAEALWVALLGDERVKPAGLGARDTLRLEVGLPLYGHDLGETRTPAEAGYAGMLTSQAEYVGREGAHNVTQRLVALSFAGRRSAREGDRVHLPSGDAVGVVTSGSFGPSVGTAIALAYVDEAHAGEDSFVVRAARAELPAARVTLPFYTKGTARMALV